ncbi:MAG: hypothetical protein J0L73_21655 [Verrucomicrobia bacterium]|nr:hypothetical protein [Verrucomicrobiota bacterium]
MHHFLIRFEQNKDGVDVVESAYYANAKQFNFCDFLQLPIEILTSTMHRLQPEGFEESAKDLLKPLCQSMPEMVISAFISSVIDEILNVSPTRFSRPCGFYSIKVYSSFAPVDGTLEKMVLTEGGIEIWSLKNLESAEKYKLDRGTEI